MRGQVHWKIIVAQNKKFNIISMARPFIIEPDLVNKFKAGKQTKSKCIQYNFCIIGDENGSLRCSYGKVPVK
jgi:2,4-dienoyl-CoA reductase-like NADH-dependent reductase (Old Yellow Enzyme family)